MNKKQLAILLSKLSTFKKQDLTLEQYQTECEIAAETLWFAFMNKDIKGKIIADLGCGNGILGLGALILEAKKVFFVDIHKEILSIAKSNLNLLQNNLNKKFNAVFLKQDVNNFNKKVNIVIQNPPFGVKKSHADRVFLIKAMEIAQVIYSFHKIESESFIKKLSEENNFKIEVLLKFNFPIKKTLPFYRKNVYYVQVGCWKLVKK